MLKYARSVVGKPFSNSGMVRSLFWPRKTNGTSFFCAGLLERAKLSPAHLRGRNSSSACAHHLTCVCVAPITAAELVASVLRVGGLIDSRSNPGCATPESLHALYRHRASTTANPYLLRQVGVQKALTTTSVVQERVYVPPQLNVSRSLSARAASAPPSARSRELAPMAGTARGTTALRVLSAGVGRSEAVAPPIGLTLNSLNFRR